MASYMDITQDLIERIAAHHDANPAAYQAFEGSNGLVLTTRAGWKLDPAKPQNIDGFRRRIERAVRQLRNYGHASLPIAGGTLFVFVTVRRT